MLTELENVQAVGAAVDGDRARARALAVRLRGLPGQVHARARREARRARGRARGDGRRRDGALPDDPPEDGQRARPRAARAARPRDVGGDRGAPEPGLPRRRRGRPARASLARSPDLRRALRALRLPAEGARRAVRGVPRRHRAALRGADRRGLAGACSASRSTTFSAGTSQRLLRSPQWDEGFPGDQMVPALRATLADLGIDLDSQENIKLDIEQRPAEDAARVLLADRGAGQGDARDPADRRRRRLARASSTRPATPSTSATPRATWRWRRSGSATWRSPRAGRC